MACKHLIGHLERLAKVEVHQGVHSQELSSRIKSFSSQWKLVPARATSSKSFLKKINIQLVLLAYYKLSGLTGGLANLGQNSHLKRDFYLSGKS